MPLLLIWLALVADAQTAAPPELDARFVALSTQDRVPLRKLQRITDALVEVRLERAQQMAGLERWSDALAELSAARKRLIRAADLGLTTDESAIDDAEDRIRRRAISHHNAAAQVALDDGRPGAGLARIGAAEALGGTPDPTLKGRLLAALGEEHAAAGRPIEAADAWAEGAGLWPDPDLAARSADANRSLAESAMARGACRTAAKHFAQVPDPSQAKTAMACARTAVTVEWTIDDTRKNGRELVRRADQAMRARLAEAGSRHLALDAVGPRTVPTKDGPKPRGPIQITAAIGAPELDHGAPVRVLQRSPARSPFDGGWNTVIVTWEAMAEPVSAQLAAQVEQRDVATSIESGIRAVGRAEVQAQWAGAILGYEISGTTSHTVATIEWGPKGDPVAKRSAQTAREEARTQATALAAEALGQALAQRILDEHDRE